MNKIEKAVITVIGKDMVGILAKVSNMCAEKGVNVLEVTQSILQDMFVMVMLVDITDAVSYTHLTAIAILVCPFFPFSSASATASSI